MSWLAAAQIAAPIIGGMIGASQAGSAQDQANKFRQLALEQYAGINIPDEEKQRLLLEQYSNAGMLTPELEQLINLGNTAQEGISLDPSIRQKQLESLAGIADYANTGVTAADQANYELARRNSAAEANAQSQAIMANMQARGQGGSGAELIARLQTQQSAADRLQQAQLAEAAKRQEARMQALQMQSNMAGNLRGQEYGEQANLANARDAVARFNAQNAQQVSNANTGLKNQAQQYNLANQQRIADANIGLKNQQQQHNKGLQQQTFNNQMSKAAGMSGQYQQNAQASQQQAANTAAGYAGIGQGVGSILSAFNQKEAPAGAAVANQNVLNKLPQYNPATGRYE